MAPVLTQYDQAKTVYKKFLKNEINSFLLVRIFILGLGLTSHQGTKPWMVKIVSSRGLIK